MKHHKNIKDLCMKLPNEQQVKNILERKISGVQKLFRRIADDLDVLKRELNPTGENTTDQMWTYKDSSKEMEQTDLKE